METTFFNRNKMSNFKIFKGNETEKQSASCLPANPTLWYWEPNDYDDDVLWSIGFIEKEGAEIAARLGLVNGWVHHKEGNGTTDAEAFGELLGENGLVWYLDSGEHFEDTLESVGAQIDESPDNFTRYTFDDGSCIVTTPSFWAYGLSKDCFCMCGESQSHQEGCEL